MKSSATTAKRAELVSFRTANREQQKRIVYHWPEYLIEAGALGTFMISACVFSALLNHPASPVSQMITSEFARRCLAGLAMGLTAIAIIYSPWGKKSGAQLNPSVTLGFLSLSRISRRDALFYIGAQFVGGALGVGIASLLLGNRISHPSISYAVTKPGTAGVAVAFVAEFVISFILFTVVLNANARPRLMRFTGLIAGTLVFLYISLEAPLSGMSMNPARSFASAVWPGVWSSQWIYFVAPPIAMLLAAELFKRSTRAREGCAKFVHDPKHSCIFCGHSGQQ
jgi:aquaporin Z